MFFISYMEYCVKTRSSIVSVVARRWPHRYDVIGNQHNTVTGVLSKSSNVYCTKAVRIGIFHVACQVNFVIIYSE